MGPREYFEHQKEEFRKAGKEFDKNFIKLAIAFLEEGNTNGAIEILKSFVEDDSN